MLVVQNHPHPNPLPDYRERGQEVTRPTTAASLPGAGSIEFTRVGVHTAVTRSKAQSPLKLLCPRGAGQSAWVFASNYGGGLVSGDEIRLRVHAGEGTTSLLSTQASTKIYRSTSESGARQSTDVRIEAGALCVIAPDPVSCFANARYEQRQRFYLDESASLVLIDSLCSGRVAHGERWAFSRYRSCNEIFLMDRRGTLGTNGRPHLSLPLYSGGRPGWRPVLGKRASEKKRDLGATPPPPQPSPGVPGEGEKPAEDAGREMFPNCRRVFRDVLLLDPADGPLDHPQRLGSFNCLATTLLFGPRVQSAATALLDSISVQPPGVDRNTGLLLSASPLRIDGVDRGAILRIAGPSTEPVGRFLHAQLKFLAKPLGEDPWKRKW